jgi:hypothetical protein
MQRRALQLSCIFSGCNKEGLQNTKKQNKKGQGAIPIADGFMRGAGLARQRA